MDTQGQIECMSCGQPLSEKERRQRNGPNRVPSIVDCCWSCWTSISPDKRIMITIAVQDRRCGGVIAEVAAAIERFDQSRDDDLGDSWGRLSSE